MKNLINYFISYETTVLVGTEDKYMRTFKNNTEMMYPLITSLKDIRTIEEQLVEFLLDTYNTAHIPVEIMGVSVLNYIQFDNDYVEHDQNKVQ